MDRRYLEFATSRQRELIEAYIAAEGNAEEAGRAMGVAGGQVRAAVNRVKAKAANQATDEYDLPPGQTLKGVSRHENSDGSWDRQWVKSRSEGIEGDASDEMPDPKTMIKQSRYFDSEGKVIGRWVSEKPEFIAMRQQWQDYADHLLERVPARLPVPAPGISTSSDLLNQYTMTDSHIGMLAWGKETTGSDWDLDIARKTLTACFGDMVARAPAADECVIAQLGDWMHYDSLDSITPTSGHILDADSRAGKMVPTACDVLEDLVTMALQKHNKVHLLVAEGNHDMFGSLWLRTMFRRIFRDNPRVQIIESENPYYAMRWGVTMLGFHHGHKKGPAPDLIQVFSSMYRSMWGETDHCVIHTGDKHHKSVKEYSGATIEQHGTLAANDAYAIRGGWRSHQYAEAITYHRTMGEAGRVRTNPSMVGL